MSPAVIRAGKANMFLSPVFTEAFVNATNVPVELYNSDGSVGRRWVRVSGRVYSGCEGSFCRVEAGAIGGADEGGEYEELYGRWRSAWKSILQTFIK
jgi:xylulokinase